MNDTTTTDIKQELQNEFLVSLETGRRLLRLGEHAARAAIRRGDIPTTNIGRTIMIPTSFIRQKLLVDAA